MSQPKVVGYVVAGSAETEGCVWTGPVLKSATTAVEEILKRGGKSDNTWCWGHWSIREVLEYPGTVERIALVDPACHPEQGYVFRGTKYAGLIGEPDWTIRLYERTTPATRKLGKVV